MGMNFFDSFTSFLSGLGIFGRDKGASMVPSFKQLTQLDVERLYRGDWVSRKIIDIPANDSTREWRDWQADDDDIEQIEEAERAFGIQNKLNHAMIKARLYGGAALVMGVDGTGPFNTELDIENVKKDSLKFVHVVSRWRIAAGPPVRDITSPWYGEPSYYERTTNVDTPPPGGVPLPASTMSSGTAAQLFIHPSRVIRLIGLEYPDIEQAQDSWSDSALQPVYDAVRDANLVGSSIAHLIGEAKFDVIKVPNLGDIMSTDAGAQKLSARFNNVNAAKSVINAVLLDANEEWNRVTATFTGMPEIMQMYLAIACAAADVPATRFLGKSPDGLNATGDGDLRNYYDRLSSDQKTRVQPAVSRLDEVLLRHIFGTRPEDIYYEWSPLWQLDETQKADIGLKKAQAFQIDVNAALIKPEVLAKVRVAQLTEDGTYPGIEAAVDEFGEFDPEEADRKALEEADLAHQKNLELVQAKGEAGAQAKGGNDNFPPKKKAVGDRRFARDFNPYHEPGGSPLGGQFTSGSGGGGASEQELRRDLSLKTSNIKQPVNDFENLYRLAKQAEPKFKEEVEGLAKRFGGLVHYTPKEFAEPGTTLKTMQSAFRKVNEPDIREPENLRDIIRATVVMPTVHDTRKAAATFIAEYGERVVVVKDRIVNPTSGYRDILINYRTEHGMVAELQFNTPKILEVKQGIGHRVYERARDLQLHNRMTLRVKTKLDSISVKAYEAAYKADGNGNWSTVH